ncbi:MAG: hypothetical protein ACRDSP_12880 [Pseudonocardiaceae bacterium]
MIKDPLTVWDGPFPYDLLAPVGVHPELPHSAMQAVAFDLMTRGLMNPQTHRACDELRTVARRLLVDLLCYDVVPADHIDAARAEVEHELGDPGEPAEVTEALTLGPALLGELADELDELVLDAPRDVAGGAPIEVLDWPGLLDQLIRFDR